VSQKFSWILAALYFCCFFGLLAFGAYLFDTSTEVPDAAHMMPFPSLFTHETIYISLHESWKVFALAGATLTAAVGTQWSRLVWYCKYREAGGQAQSPMVQI
jgi:hypothetical protein